MVLPFLPDWRDVERVENERRPASYARRTIAGKGSTGFQSSEAETEIAADAGGNRERKSFAGVVGEFRSAGLDARRRLPGRPLDPARTGRGVRRPILDGMVRQARGPLSGPRSRRGAGRRVRALHGW